MAESKQPELALVGINVLVTRGEAQANKLSEKLKGHGANPIELAVIHFGKPASYEPVDDALRSLAPSVKPVYDWIIFASSNAVTAVVERSTTLGINLQDTENVKIAAIGPGTAAMLDGFGLKADFHPSSFVAEKFLEQFPDLNRIEGKRILWPRTNVGRTLIADQLRALGATVDTVEAYTTELPPAKETVARRLIKMLADGCLQVITLASSQTVRNFAELIALGISLENQEIDGSPIDANRLLNRVLIATIGPITSSTARELLGRVDIEADVHTADGLVNSLVRNYAMSG